MVDDLTPWRDAVEAARLEARQLTPVRQVAWEKGVGSCSYSTGSDTISIGTGFAHRHEPTSPMSRSVLLHELGHRHFQHRHRTAALQAAAVLASLCTVVAIAVGATLIRNGDDLFTALLLPAVLLVCSVIVSITVSPILIRKTHRRWEHEADDYATDVAGPGSLVALSAYATLTGFSGWASSHPTPAERVARQRERLGLD